MKHLGPRTMRRLGCGLLIAVAALVLLFLLALSMDRLPAGWRTAQVRLDTGDLRYCILGVPYRYDLMPDRERQTVLRLSAMDPPLPAKWQTVASYPVQGSNNPDQSERDRYLGVLAAAELDPSLGRLALNGLAFPYLPPGSVQEQPPSSWLWFAMIYGQWDSQRGQCLKPGWFDSPAALTCLAWAAYKPIRLEDSAPDAAAYLWPDLHNPAAVDDLGRTVLHRAAFWGREDLVRKMLLQGLDRDARNKDGWTPLHVAAFWGQVQVVQVLLDAGAAVNLKALGGEVTIWPDGSRPLWEQWDAIGATALHVASVQGRDDVVRCLLDRGAHVDALAAKGRTPLMWAAAAGRADVVKELLARGANASLEDSQGMSARDCAKRHGRAAVERMLQ